MIGDREGDAPESHDTIASRPALPVPRLNLEPHQVDIVGLALVAIGVFLAGATRGSRVGELDEEMVFESRVGDTIILGASTWRIDEITHDRVLVSPAPGEPGKMPFWHGDTAGRPAEFGQKIGAMTRELAQLPRPVALTRLIEDHSLDGNAADVNGSSGACGKSGRAGFDSARQRLVQRER